MPSAKETKPKRVSRYPKPKKTRRRGVTAPEVVVRIYAHKIIQGDEGGYVAASDYSDGHIGYFIISRWAMSKIRQMYKQMLVLRVDGVTISADLPGIRYIAELSATLYPRKTYDEQKEYQSKVGTISVTITKGYCRIDITDEETLASAGWVVTEALQKEFDEVQSNYDEEWTKRHAWLDKYQMNGCEPITDRPGAQRGRKPKEQPPDDGDNPKPKKK